MFDPSTALQECFGKASLQMPLSTASSLLHPDTADHCLAETGTTLMSYSRIHSCICTICASGPGH